MPIETDLRNALYGQPATVNAPLRILFLIAFDRLKSAEIANPMIHHLVVLKHALRLAASEGLDPLISGAISLLHDCSPIAKIRKADVELQENAEYKRFLEQCRIQFRTLHMREGSATSQRMLLYLNEYFGHTVYTDEAIDEVVEVIAAHDSPSINIPIPANYRMAVAFREADRLWMLSSEGFAYDLNRDRKHITNVGIDLKTLAGRRLEHIVKRFIEERAIYRDSDGPFYGGTYIRTGEGYKMYLDLLAARRKEYEIQ